MARGGVGKNAMYNGSLLIRLLQGWQLLYEILR